jgi:hypothetical protein
MMMINEQDDIAYALDGSSGLAARLGFILGNVFAKRRNIWHWEYKGLPGRRQIGLILEQMH